MTEKTPDFEWDELAIIESEIKYRIKHKSVVYDYNHPPTDDEIRKDIENDCDIITWAFNDFIDKFQTRLNKIATRYKEELYWTVEVSSAGWRGIDEEMDVFYENNARKLLGKILPNCECQYKIFMNRTGFTLQNWHHDSPVGNEWYTVNHATNKEVIKSEILNG